MNLAYAVRQEKRAAIPAPTHVDGTGRLQTVSRRTNPRYWSLIKEFEKLTGVPVLLNTSFNENEPIVLTPEEAIDCFLRTKMDVLVLGEYIIEKTPKPSTSEARCSSFNTPAPRPCASFCSTSIFPRTPRPRRRWPRRSCEDCRRGTK